MKIFELSLVIPCYNCSDNIINLLNKIYLQKSDFFEVILVNDGSIDDTQQIVENYILNNNIDNIKLFNKENQGAAKARQFGLDQAQGEYVFFCDSDDMLSDDAVEKILITIKEQPDLIYFNSVMVQENELSCSYTYKVKFNENKIYTNGNDFFKRQLYWKYWTAAVWTFVFKRSLVKSAQAYFTDRIAHEDHMFAMSLVLYSSRTICLNHIIYIQKVRKGSLTNSKKNWDYVWQRYLAFKETDSRFKSSIEIDTYNLYKHWSIISVIKLFKDYDPMFVRVFFNFQFYMFLFSELKTIFSFLLSNRVQVIK